MGVERLKDNLKAVFTTPPVGDPADSSAQGIAAAIMTEIADPVGSSVTSVNGRSGDVVLSASDVGLENVDNTADADKPVSTAVQAALDGKAAAEHGHDMSDVSGLTDALAGKSNTGHTHASATQQAAGFLSTADKTKLDGVASGATNTPLTATPPANLGASAAAGVSTEAARADHVHVKPTPQDIAAAPASHTHTIANVTGLQTALDGKLGDAEQAADSAKIAGVTPGTGGLLLAALPALSSASPAMNGTAAPGASNIPARQDHVHPSDTTRAAASHDHADATQAADGFMSATDKTKLDGIASGATNTPLASTAPANLGAAAAVGTGSTAARADHVHKRPTLAELGAAASSHAHAISDVTGLQTALDGKIGDAEQAADSAKLAGVTPGAGGLLLAALSALSSATPGMNGTAAAGTSNIPARQDHVHPVDTSRAASSHGHAQADITGLVAALAAKLGTSEKAADSAKLAGVTPGTLGLALIDDADAAAGRTTLDAMQQAKQVGFYGTNASIATTDFVAWLTTEGYLSGTFKSTTLRGTWHYAGNCTINDTGDTSYPTFQLAGAVVKVTGTTTAYTIEVSEPNTSTGAYTDWVYVNNGSTYSPGWRRILNTKTSGAGGLLLLALSALSSASPAMNGTAAAGSSNIPARQDHVHPVDTSRAAASHGHAQADITDLASSLAAKLDATAQAADSAKLGINNTAGLSSCLQFIQSTTQTTGGDLPTATWYHVLKMNHGNGDTYYNRSLAFAFSNDDVFTRRRVGGTAFAYRKLAFDDEKLGITAQAADSAKLATITPGAGGLLLLALSALSSASPAMNGAAAAGSSNIPARQDHVHPVDTSRAPASHAHTFASLTSKPTTLAGYGITDAVSSGDKAPTGALMPYAGEVTEQLVVSAVLSTAKTWGGIGSGKATSEILAVVKNASSPYPSLYHTTGTYSFTGGMTTARAWSGAALVRPGLWILCAKGGVLYSDADPVLTPEPTAISGTTQTDWQCICADETTGIGFAVTETSPGFIYRFYVNVSKVWSSFQQVSQLGAKAVSCDMDANGNLYVCPASGTIKIMKKDTTTLVDTGIYNSAWKAIAVDAGGTIFAATANTVYIYGYNGSGYQLEFGQPVSANIVGLTYSRPQKMLYACTASEYLYTFDFQYSIPDASWLPACGQSLGRTANAALFGVLGTKYGYRDSSSFFLPDMREVVPVGVGSNITHKMATHDAFTLGQFKDDQMQGHRHAIQLYEDATTTSGSDRPARGAYAVNGIVLDPITDGVNGTPRTGQVTRGKRIGMNYIIKT